MVLHIVLTCSLFHIRGSNVVILRPNTGNSAEVMLIQKAGLVVPEAVVLIVTLNVLVSLVLIFFNVLENSRPAISNVGIAIIIP